LLSREGRREGGREEGRDGRRRTTTRTIQSLTASLPLTSTNPSFLPSLPPSLPLFQAEDGTTVKHREGSWEAIPSWGGEGGREGGGGVEKVVVFVRKGGLTVAEPFGEKGGREGGREGVSGESVQELVRSEICIRRLNANSPSPPPSLPPSVLSSLPNALPPSNIYTLVDFEGGARMTTDPVPPSLPSSLPPSLPPVLSSLPNALPPSNNYTLVDFEGGANIASEPTLAAFSWAMGTYKYARRRGREGGRGGGREGWGGLRRRG